MSPDKNNLVQGFMDMLDKAGKLYCDAQRAREKDALVNTCDALDTNITVDILPFFEVIAESPVWDALKGAVQNAVARMLEEESFSPFDAAKPAQHLLQALETLKRCGTELQYWGSDENLKTSNPAKLSDSAKLADSAKLQKAGIMKWCRTPQPMRVSVPVVEIVEQLTYVMGLLTMAGREAHLASEAIVHARDPRLHIVSMETPPNLPHIEVPEYFMPLTIGQYVAGQERGRELLSCLSQFGSYLVRMAELGRVRLEKASVDNKAFSPGVVAAEANTISNLVKNGLSTCNALAIVAPQYIGEMVTVKDAN